MRIQQPVREIKRFIRATKDAFDKVVASETGNEYALTYSVKIQTTPIVASEIKSLLEAIDKSISAFDNDGAVEVSLDINHQNGFDGKLLNEVRGNYEASKKLEEAAAPAAAKAG